RVIASPPWGQDRRPRLYPRGPRRPGESGHRWHAGRVHTPRATNHHPSTVPAPSAIRDVYVLARRRDDVLLLLRSGTGYRDGEWGPPAGKVEPGETYAEAAARELAEETGIRVGPLDLRF